MVNPYDPFAPALTLGEADVALLISFWKPLLLILVFVPWAWVVSKIYDKHAARFFLPRQQWNLFHMCMACLAIFGAIGVGMLFKSELGFWIGLAFMLIVLSIDLFAYARVANADDRVPERFKIRLDIASKMADAREAKREVKAQGEVALTIEGPDGQKIAPPNADTPEHELRVVAEQAYIKGVEARASQIDIAPGAEGAYALSVLVDGVRQNLDQFPAQDAMRLMDFWKSVAGLDVSDRRRRLVGRVKVGHGGTSHVIRVTSLGGSGGMRLTMLFDPEIAVLRNPNELGLLPKQMEAMAGIVEDAAGVVLLAAPAHSGRTTTLYAVLRMHDAYTSNIQTLELEPQARLEGIRTNEFDPQTSEGEFATTLRSILRRDPDAVGVGDLPDAATAREAAMVDVERARVYISVRADNALTAVQGWAKAVGDPDMAAKSLHGVVAQRLVRKVCLNCRVPYQPTPEMLAKLGLPEGKVQQLFKKGGQVLIKNKPEVCPVCSGVGYHGQDGVFEVYRIGQEERELVRTGNFDGLRAQFRKTGLPNIQQAAIIKAVEGRTTIEEIMRVTSPPRK